MMELLSRWFIRDRDNVTDPRVRRAYGQLCGLVGIGLNILLFAGKFFAGTLSGSVAITADAFNNLSDAGSSVVTLLGFRLAGKKPDPQHPFGHGRLEYVSGLIVAGLILLMGVELAKSSVEKILHPAAVDFSVIALVILAVSICVKLYMCLYNRRIGKKIRSAAMEATAADSLSDTAATAAVLLAMLIARWTGLDIDGWVGLVVAGFILFSGVKSARETISPLLGQPRQPGRPLDLPLLFFLQERAQGLEQLQSGAVLRTQLTGQGQQLPQELRVQSAQGRSQVRPRRRGRGRRGRLLLPHGSGQLLGHLHDLGHAVGIGQQRVQFFLQLRHCRPSFLFLQAFADPLHQGRPLGRAHDALKHPADGGGVPRRRLADGLLQGAAPVAAGQQSQQHLAVPGPHHRLQGRRVPLQPLHHFLLIHRKTSIRCCIAQYMCPFRKTCLSRP